MTFQIVDILMSTYNGSLYLEEQFKSILEQSYQNWRLIVRDDGSSDNSVEIISELSRRDSRIMMLQDCPGNVGPCASFFELLHHVEAPYFMFSDQDDFWLPHKIEFTLNKLKETANGSGIPVLVYSDLIVVDSNLNVISKSFWQHQKLKPEKYNKLRMYILQNIVTGCTVGGNKALIDKALNINIDSIKKIIMHDWWVALVASCCGKIGVIDQPLIMYRQHSFNSLGAKGAGIARYVDAIKSGDIVTKLLEHLNKVSKQISVLTANFSDDLLPEDMMILNAISRIQGKWSFVKLFSFMRSGIRFKNLDFDLSALCLLAVSKIYRGKSRI